MLSNKLRPRTQQNPQFAPWSDDWARLLVRCGAIIPSIHVIRSLSTVLPRRASRLPQQIVDSFLNIKLYRPVSSLLFSSSTSQLHHQLIDSSRHYPFSLHKTCETMVKASKSFPEAMESGRTFPLTASLIHSCSRCVWWDWPGERREKRMLCIHSCF